MLEWMGLNFYYYDGLQPKMRAGIINEHECTRKHPCLRSKYNSQLSIDCKTTFCLCSFNISVPLLHYDLLLTVNMGEAALRKAERFIAQCCGFASNRKPPGTPIDKPDHLDNTLKPEGCLRKPDIGFENSTNGSNGTPQF